MATSVKIIIACTLFGCSSQSQKGDSEIKATGSTSDTDVSMPTEEVRSPLAEVSNPNTAPVLVALTPSDLSSSIRGTDVIASVGLGVNPPDDLLEELSGRFSMRSVNSESLVALRVQVLDASEEDETERSRRIMLSSTDDLASDWHEVQVNLEGLDAVAAGALVPRGEGNYVARVHPDSAPVLKRVQSCASTPSDGNVDVTLDFSEEINFMPRPSTVHESPVEIYLTGSPCDLQPNVIEEEEGEYASTLQFKCSRIDLLDSLEIVFLRELLTVGGLPATTYDAQPLVEVALEYENAFGDGCKYWHMQ